MAQEDKFVVPHRKPAVGKSTVVSVRLPDTMLAKLENVATQTGRTRNELGADVHRLRSGPAGDPRRMTKAASRQGGCFLFV